MNSYHAVGLRTVINADGMKTRLGGSLMPPEVLEAMRQAGRCYVDLLDLHRAAGHRIAELVDSPAIEDAAVVCGAAADRRSHGEGGETHKARAPGAIAEARAQAIASTPSQIRRASSHGATGRPVVAAEM